MDELGKILGNILSSMPSGNENAQERGNKSVPPRDAPSAEPAAESFAPFSPSGSSGSMDFSGLLNSFSSAPPPSSQRRALLTALKPYLRPARRAKLDRAQNLINAAYSVRAVLGTLGTLEGTHDV